MERWQQSVLVIDRDADVREALQLALEDEGYAVRTTTDTATALSMLRASSRPMVVLFDVVTQLHLSREDNGLAIVDAVAQEAALLGRHAYVMMSTTPEQAAALTGPMPAQSTMPVLRKPFELSELVRTVGQAAHVAQHGRAYGRVS